MIPQTLERMEAKAMRKRMMKMQAMRRLRQVASGAEGEARRLLQGEEGVQKLKRRKALAEEGDDQGSLVDDYSTC